MGVFEETEDAPSPLVVTEATKLPLKTAPVGRSEIVGVVGVACPTEKVWGLPTA